MSDALAATSALIEGKLCKPLKKILKKISEDGNEMLAVGDSKLGKIINEKYSIGCLANNSVQELMRSIRTHINSLLGGEIGKESGFSDKRLENMSLGLAHSLSRYKLKFSPDKIDTMIIQAIC